MSTFSSVIDRRWWYGGPRDFWIQNAAAVKLVIEAGKLQPIPAEHTATPVLLRVVGGSEAVPLPHRPFPGGMKLPHLHLDGQAYLVNEAQWKEFTAKALGEFRARLERAKVVSFEQLMAVADAVGDVHG